MWGALVVAIVAAVFSGIALKHSKDSAAAALRADTKIPVIQGTDSTGRAFACSQPTAPDATNEEKMVTWLAPHVLRSISCLPVATELRGLRREFASGTATPRELPVCLERQGPRPANRRVPADTVRSQHQAMVASHQRLAAEGFNTVVFADALYRLEPFLKRLSQVREADLGRDGNEGLGDLWLARRFFGPEILPLWRWRPGSDLVTGRDRVAEIRLGQQYLTLALREDVDGEGDFGFDVLLPCPFDPECDGQAWAPAYSVSRLFRALTGAMDNDPDIVCTVHGDGDGVDQEADDHDLQDDDPEGRADLEAQYADAVRA